jgi:metallophosphoesterase (TIGR03767 family)
MTPPPLTNDRILAAGQIRGRGLIAAYRGIGTGPGEPHLLREELARDATSAPDDDDHPFPGPPAPGRRALLVLAHLTDLHLVDVQSPARFEFFNAEWADPRFADLIPVQRPQEALITHAVATMVDTLGRITAAPGTGAPLDLVVTTGDAIDNTQQNELRMLMALFDAGTVTPGSGDPGYRGVQSPDWPGDVYWRPDGDGPDGPDLLRTGFAFPTVPGLLTAATSPFSSTGLALPWLACYGNHEALIQGVGAITPTVQSLMTGPAKPAAMPVEVDLDRAVEEFTASCDRFAGRNLPVAADPGRRPLRRQDFVRAHLRRGANPPGHGFTEENLSTGTAHYCHDTPTVRLIGLDTACSAGSSEGTLDAAQLAWLEDRLIEVHSEYRDERGRPVSTGNRNRLVVLLSHHGPDVLARDRADRSPGETDPASVTSDEVLALIHRFGNVVLWLNGHTHIHAARPRHDPTGRSRGFWEVTTGAIMDWPCQSRLVEIVDEGDGMLSLICTMVDHDAPLRPPSPQDPEFATVPGLASWHRELAANAPRMGFGSALPGTPADRNVILRLPAPFPLEQLPGS